MRKLILTVGLVVVAFACIASGASAKGELADTEMAIGALVDAYNKADADPAEGRKFVKRFCEQFVEGGIYSDMNDDERRDVECRTDTYQLFLSFKRSNGNVVSSATWFSPAKWEATVKTITKVTGVPYVKRDGVFIWSGPKNKEGWWFEVAAKRNGEGSLVIYGWNNNP